MIGRSAGGMIAFFQKPDQNAMAARSTSVSATLTLALALVLLAACSRRPSETDCRVSLANFLRLQMGSHLTNARINELVEKDPVSQTMIQRCMSDKSYELVQCEMTAQSMADLQHCKSDQVKP
ncbi:MAG: hypothetical protein KDK39_13710 [Leptospiraceae bacterium]|nr:hypothetical protein [Leptospiraceae bacterium]